MNAKRIDEFAEWCLTECKIRQNTVKTYKNILGQVSEDVDLSMDEISITGVLNIYIARKGRIAIYAFKKFIEFLYEKYEGEPDKREMMRRKKNNIIANLELPESRKREKSTALTKEDIEEVYVPPITLVELLKHCDLEMKVIVLLLYDTGCRVNEVLTNLPSNFKENGIEIPHFLSKSKKSRFVEFLIPETKMLLEKWKKLNKSDKKLFKLSYINFWYKLKKIGKEIGFKVKHYSKIGYLSEISPHDLRHTRATDLASDGWELGKLQRRLGHSDPKITNTYISYVRESKVMSLEKFIRENNINLRNELLEIKSGD